MTIEELIRQISFGSRVAEEEGAKLKNYFVQTNEWKRVYGGEVDIVYGPKGSGKSAIYSLLSEEAGRLFDGFILFLAAENPRGATAFADLETDPPTSEREFEQLWKMYLSSLIASLFSEYGVSNDSATELSRTLRANGLLTGNESLGEKFTKAFDFVRKYIRPSAIEAGLKVDPMSGLPSGITGKLSFEGAKPHPEEAVLSPDALLKTANKALEQAGFTVWLAVDRLDVAFKENEQLEANALRALFKVYLDLMAFNNIRLMIFLRSDIWKRITDAGFREASHITKTLTITWSRDSLLNLIMRRLLQSQSLQSALQVDLASVLADLNVQEGVFYRVFPRQVDLGEKKPTTIDWLLSRTKDGTGHNAPRELIHLLNECRDIQLQKIGLGTETPEGDNLFARSVLKEALKPVSKVRLEQTLLAEYPSLKTYVLKLEKEKATQRLDTLSQIWQSSIDEAKSCADKLTEVGFFERRGTKQSPIYWVPFLYRDALGLVQGEAE